LEKIQIADHLLKNDALVKSLKILPLPSIPSRPGRGKFTFYEFMRNGKLLVKLGRLRPLSR
jgi:hypothetical protein